MIHQLATLAEQLDDARRRRGADMTVEQWHEDALRAIAAGATLPSPTPASGPRRRGRPASPQAARRRAEVDRLVGLLVALHGPGVRVEDAARFVAARVHLSMPAARRLVRAPLLRAQVGMLVVEHATEDEVAAARAVRLTGRGRPSPN